jgi:hypothetical protein
MIGQEISNQGMQREQIISREPLLHMSAEIISMCDEIESEGQKKDQHTSQVEMLENRNRMLCEEVEQLREELAERSTYTEVASASMEEGQKWKESAERLGRDVEELRGRFARAKTESTEWKAKAEELQERGIGMVDAVELLAAKATAAAMREESAAVVEVMEMEVETLREQLQEVQEYNTAL